MSDIADKTRAEGMPPQRCSLLLRGGAVIADPRQPAIADGAVCVDDDRIVAVGTYADLRRRYAPARELGSPQHVLLPGFINAHDHGRAPSSLQVGIADDALELWIVDLLRQPDVDPALATAYACAGQIEAGVTTVLHSFFEGAAGRYAAAVDATAAGYSAAGMRAVLALSVLDQSHIAAWLQAATPLLPAALRQWAETFLRARRPLPADEYFEVAPAWCADHRGARVSAMLGPVSVHWCSETLLLRIWREAEAVAAHLQTHLLESPYQRRSALAQYGRSAVAYLAERGLLTPRLSCAHCVQVGENDIALLAEAGVSVVHNPGSNLRLGNGIAPLPAMLRGGVNVALGLDSLALNDDGDMLQEMRLAACLHRPADVPDTAAVLAMATINGARALGIEDRVGTLAAGKKADLVLLRRAPLDAVCEASPATDAAQLVLRARRRDVDSVVIDGRVVLHQGRHLSIDKEALQREIGAVLRRSPAAELQWRQRVKALKPYLRKLLETP